MIDKYRFTIDNFIQAVLSKVYLITLNFKKYSTFVFVFLCDFKTIYNKKKII